MRRKNHKHEDDQQSAALTPAGLFASAAGGAEEIALADASEDTPSSTADSGTSHAHHDWDADAAG